MSILELHRRAKAPGRIGYDERKRRYEALHAAAAVLCAKLPFQWRAVSMDNPTQNHTGTTNGADHIVLDEAYSAGRIHRAAGQALCGADTANLFTPAFENHVTCKRCLELAERLATA